MKNNILSIDKLIELLNTEEYQYVAPEKEFIKEFEDHNMWTSPAVLNLWEDILNKTGQPPKAKEFLERGSIMTKNYWYEQSSEGRLPKYTMTNGSWVTTYLQWNKNMERAVIWRLSRMYESYMFEYSAMSIVHTNLPKLTLLSSREMDLVLGVDLVAINNDSKKIAYIHITKDTKWAVANIASKGKKTAYLKDRNGKKHYWHRRFNDNHLVLLYDRSTGKKAMRVNGNYIFNRDYVVEMLTDKFEEDIEITAERNELHDFHTYLVNNRVKKSGIKKMFIKYTFEKY